MGRTEAPGAGFRRLSLAAALLLPTSSTASPSAASFSLRDGMAPMAAFRDGIFTVRARAQFERPDGYLALAFGSAKSPRKYYVILTRTGMKLWKLDGAGARRLLDAGRFDLSAKQEITLRFSIKGRRYLAEVQGYPPLIADDEDSFAGRLVLRVAGASVDYDDPVVELPAKL